MLIVFTGYITEYNIGGEGVQMLLRGACGLNRQIKKIFLPLFNPFKIKKFVAQSFDLQF